MGLPEVMYRAGRAIQSKLEGHGYGLAAPGLAAGQSGAPWCAHFPTTLDSVVYRVAADRILAGRFDVFALRNSDLGFPPKWNCDPKSGTVAPMVFGKAINYRDERVVGDIKYVWEPNRHLELVTLAQAYRTTGDFRYALACRTFLDSWFEACPYPLGINWTSSLELAMRVVNWHFAWHLLGGENSPVFIGQAGAAFRQRWQRSVFQHCHFIAGHLSRHSSANNHILGEYMGMLVGSLTWPMWEQSARWRDLAAAGFEEEILRQNAPDGVNREQAIYYQHEVIDMMLICALIGRANGLEFSTEFWKRLESMLTFVYAVMDKNGNVPMIGDADDAVMVRLAPQRNVDIYRSLLATGALLLRRADFARKAKILDDKSLWLLGDVQSEFDALLRSAEGSAQPAPQSFPDGGYFVLGHELELPTEIRLVVDAGPLGYLSIAAHGHADALSFTLSVAGLELLIDPGTYAYHTEQRWRNYFKGTSAHNTVRVDAQDQSVSGGNFLWLHRARARCELFESGEGIDRFVGVHDGYLRLPGSVTHRREILLDKVTRQISVIDRIECTGEHEVEVFWHFAEECELELSGPQAIVNRGNTRLRLRVEGAKLKLDYAQGQDHPPLGWVARNFDEKCASPTLRWSGRIAGNSEWTTYIKIEVTDQFA
jgi:hypothetical protein